MRILIYAQHQDRGDQPMLAHVAAEAIAGELQGIKVRKGLL